MAEAGEGDRGPCASPVHQILIYPHAAENHPSGDVGHQDFGGGKGGLVNEHLSDDT